MIARITFRSEIYLEGDTLSEIRDKFENFPFYDIKDINGKDVYDYGFCEIVSVEDGNTYNDIMNQWNHAYDEEKD